MPQDLEDLRTDGQVQLYLTPTSWGHKKDVNYANGAHVKFIAM
jgi:hypothetical protein